MFNYDKLEACIKNSGKTKTYLCKQLGRPAYYLRDVIRQKNSIPDEYQKILAQELETTVEYLNDQDVPECAKKNSPTLEEDEASVLRRKISGQLESMSVEQLERFLSVIDLITGS